MNFLTTAATGIEEGTPFGFARPGIQVWEEASRAGEPQADASAEDLRLFLVSEGRVRDDLLQFLRSTSASDVRQQLLSHLAWHTNEPSIGDVEQPSCARSERSVGSARYLQPSRRRSGTVLSE